MRTTITVLLVLTGCAEMFAQGGKGLLPDFASAQFAGSIGFFSAGVGYDVFKARGRFSSHFGVVPAKHGGTLNVVAVKLLYQPLSVPVSARATVNPLDFGVMGSYHYGDDFETRWPEGVHPRGYYWWHPALRAHLLLETNLTYLFPKDRALQSVTAYVEFNTNELYLVSFIQNISTVSLADVVKLGTGIRVHF